MKIFLTGIALFPALETFLSIIPSQRLCLHGARAKVDAYVKELFVEVKQGGGFMMSPAVPLPAEARPECVKALMNAVKRYGVY